MVRQATSLLRQTGAEALPLNIREGIKAIICDAIWTADRLARAGYDCSPLCQHCGQRDTWAHRVLDCPAAGALRRELLDEEALQFAREHEAHLRGLFEAPSSFMPPPAEEEGVNFWSIDGRPRECVFHGDVFVDGSCSKHQDPYFDRAAWAAIKIDASGKLLARLSGPVWHGLPQTSPAAEFAAIAALAQVAARGTVVFSDYSGTVLAFSGKSGCLDGRRKFAGLTRAALAAEGWPNISAVHKVAAHQDLDWIAKGTRTWFLAKGNQVADSWAKEAVHRHPRADQKHLDKMRKFEAAKAVLLFGARMLEIWPRPGRLAKLPKEEGPVAYRRDDGHSWAFAAGLWRCQLCSRFAFEDPRGGRHRGPRCPGHVPALKAILERRRGHSIQVHQVDDAEGTVILICIRCGRWSGRRAEGTLTWVCLGSKTKAGRDALRAVGKGRHPRMDFHVGPGYPVPLQDGEAA